ncbi:MAG: biopolymer transporter ExbD [Spirochaetaceae bacterium]|jgi:biopolymer transport protein ExbD|nr:biopolymer transporter ExbD [Spirochaetaceae bacterium]
MNVSTNATSDVAFLLLIFIMLVALINYRKEINIEYPEARSVLKVSDKKNLEIWVNYTGSVFIDGNPATLESLEYTANEIYQREPDTRIHIIADKNTPYMNVDKVMGILQSLEFRLVSLVVKDEASE